MSIALSDYNLGKSKKIAAENLYADLDLSLTIHPNLKDIRPVKDIEAVKNSVKNIILTGNFERPFQPGFGSRITQLLFEPVDHLTSIQIKEEIKRVIGLYEPRVSVTRVMVRDESDRNRYDVTIQFLVNYYDEAPEVRFYLERLR